MGDEMWRLWFTKLLVLVAIGTIAVRSEVIDLEASNEPIRASRVERDLQEVTTVLLVSAQPGKSVPPLGLLTKTARTFVQDGASTEFATQVVGTTLDNGRLYAKILSTSSRVFYDKEPAPESASPYLVYPSSAQNNEWQFSGVLDNVRVIENQEHSSTQKTQDQDGQSTSFKVDELSRENDIFSKRELNNDGQRFKPAKVRTADNLPTYTVKQEYVINNFDNLEDEEPKSFKPRVPKIFKAQPKLPTAKKVAPKNLATVTYHGFADFTTTVGDTVIVFSPSTAPPPAARPATTIKGDATLRPDDGIAVSKIRPTSVLHQHKTASHGSQPSDNSNRGSGDQFLDAINGAIQPSVTEDSESESSATSTDPLLLVPVVGTDSAKPTGLIKVVDSTTALDGTTTHYKSLIYGTYIGKNYAQIIHTSSNVYFFPDEATVTYGSDDTTADYETTGTDSDDFIQNTTPEMTTGTTPRTFTEDDNTQADMNELTTPFRETTDNVLTTLKDILESARKVLDTTESALPTIDDETANDIVPADHQGRSIKGGSNNNVLKGDDKQDKSGNQNQITFATRLLPSTAYKTFTYFTTFFIPGENGQITTSTKSREVVSSEVSYLTELILPSATQSPAQPTAVTPSIVTSMPPKIEQVEEEQTTKQDEEIELIFKTLYTTYTYLTTFFQESTSSVSSNEVVETNIITQTVGPNGISAEVASLFGKEASIAITPTKSYQTVTPTATTEEIVRDTTEETYTTEDEGITTQDRYTTEGITSKDVLTTPDDDLIDDLKPSFSLVQPTESYTEQVKTYYTTYTYFTTIFVDDETEIETRTEVFTNVVTETIQPTAVLTRPQETTQVTTPEPEKAKSVAVPPPEILAYLEALKRKKSQEEALSLAKKVQTESAKIDETTEYASGTTFTTEGYTDSTTEIPTTIDDRDYKQGKSLFNDFRPNPKVTPKRPVDGEVLGSMVTDVVSSSSSGGETVLDVMGKRNVVPEDQELSESNHHDVEPAPTLLLQTSYTTFTYFTTMYKGDESTVASRLETVTNTVTETIRPSAVMVVETSTAPVTYYTTFTYWTTYYKGGDTVTTSREETVSNVVTPGVSPTPTVQLGVIMTYRPTISPSAVDDATEEERELKITADNEVSPPGVTSSENLLTTQSNEIPTLKAGKLSPSEEAVLETATVAPEPTTYYTTFTYFTTSYIGNSTILNSRLETVTSVSRPDSTSVLTPQATGRAIGGPVPAVQALDTQSKSVQPSKTEEFSKTGLISTIRSSKVLDGTTTHYATDVYGTYIDGLYAQVVESSTSVNTQASSAPVATSSSSVATPVLPTGVLSLNRGSVIDADEVTTVYFTTKQIGTLIDGLYAKVIESTSSTKIDEEKKATIPPTHGHRTGLVRLIKGNIESNGTTVVYQSKIIGTSIDGRYAQIIESTSTFVASTPTKGIFPTSTLPPGASSTGIPVITPSPAAIQSSLSDDPTSDSSDDDEDDEENEENEEEDEDEEGGISKKKSRLTFSSRKRTFTPVIRPFASRNRPTFNPKRKGAQGATTITRTDITPTITATLAGKGNRFASSRGRVSSPIGPYSSTLSPSGSRRFAGRRGSTTISSTQSSAFAGSSTRGRQQNRISPSSVFQGNRRPTTAIRGSSARPLIRGSSSVFPVASSRYRPGIRPSPTVLRTQPTAKHDDQEDDANEFTTTTLTTEETPYTEYTESGETETTPLQTTTEPSRRSTNPLLRFRRPLQQRVTTPRPSVATTTRRPSSRPTPPTVSNRAANSRAVNRGNPPVSIRPRQGNSNLFPPRGLFGRKQETTPAEEQTTKPTESTQESTESLEDDPVEEIADNDYEGSEHADKSSSTTENKRNGRLAGPVVQIRPFSGAARSRRLKRQASQLRQLTTSRFRRPDQINSSQFEERSDVYDTSSSKEEGSKTLTKPASRYNVRGRTSPTSRSSSDSSEQFSSPQKLKTPTTSRGTSARVKPSPISGSGRQFTLRENENSSASRSTYKRPTSSISRTGSRSTTKPTDSSRNRSLRYRNGSSKPSSDGRRVPSSRGSSRSSNSRRMHSQRGRNSYESIRESPLVYPENNGIITVTHYVPTEVTIPVVSHGVTEQRSIITAQPSTEVLTPDQYSTVVGGDGRPLVVIVSEVTGVNTQGQTEVTRFLLHETPTTRISHTLTTLGGRRASQSVIIPTTVYSVENIVSTIQPSLPANSPLANILLSQLLLGQFGQANPAAQTQITPTTQYNTRTTSYVTTITKLQSTVIPLTFRGKEIMTTLVDTSTNVVTATEFITDTVVVTPTATLPAANLNSLLLLLQQPQQQANPLLDPLFAAAPSLTQSNTLPGEVERRNQPADFDYKPDSYEYSEEEDGSLEKQTKSRSNRAKSGKKEMNTKASAAESSVVTLYVSGRRPGEFSTVLSTVKITEEVTASRRRRDVVEDVRVQPSAAPSLHAGSDNLMILAASEDSINAHAPTQSLESVVGEYNDYDRESYLIPESDRNDDRWSSDQFGQKLERYTAEEEADDYYDTQPRKRVRIRVPVVRSRAGRQHKYTVVRRRPLTPQSEDLPVPVPTNSPRRVVVTRVRTLGNSARNTINQNLANDQAYYEPEIYNSETLTPGVGRHRITITRRRKIQPTSVEQPHKNARITRKKLVNVRPLQVQPTPTISIITTGFYTLPSDSDEDYEDEGNEEEIEGESTPTPNLKDTPVTVDSESLMDRETTPSYEKTPEIATPVIITDNFFLPAFESEDDNESNLDDSTTTTENVEEMITVPDFTHSTSASGLSDSNDDVATTTGTPTTETDRTNGSILITNDKDTDDARDTTTPADTIETTTASIDDSNVAKEMNKTTDSFETEQESISTSTESSEDELTVKPIESHRDASHSSTVDATPQATPSLDEISHRETLSINTLPVSNILSDSDIPSVIPLHGDQSRVVNSETSDSIDASTVVPKVTTTIQSPTPEDIEAGLADDLYLSLSRPDLPQILPSSSNEQPQVIATPQPTLEPSTSVYYTETVVTSTRLRTYTYVVTKLNGLETEVTSSTTVRPRVTTLTLSLPVTVTITPTVEPSLVSVPPMYSPVSEDEDNKKKNEEEGRRLNLATRVMSNGVEVIVAGPTPALRWENSNPQPTLTLSDTVVMLLPQDKPNEFVTKTCTTTFTYLNTITKDGTTIVSTDQQVVANTATEERHRKPGAETAAVTLDASPTLCTKVYKTTYTYLTLNTDHPNIDDALDSSTKVITNTVTAPQHYLDMILEPSEAAPPETNTYTSTRILEKTVTEDDRTKIETTSDLVTQLIITDSAPPPRPTSVTTTLTALDNTETGPSTDVMKTYYITYTYYNTLLEKGSTVIRTNVATSTDVVLEKHPVKKTSTKSATVTPTPEPIQIFATKTYLTTFTYFTTLLQAGADGETSTTVSSRSHIVENVVTESIAPSLLDAGYMNALLTTSQHTDSVKNIITGSTIIFFDYDDQITPTSASSSINTATTTEIEKIESSENILSTMVADQPAPSENSKPEEEETEQYNNSTSTAEEETEDSKPANQSGSDLQVSNLLSLGSLGINSLSALGPVITAMAGLLQGKTTASRRNDTVPPIEAEEGTTQRSPIYIPVAEFADGDIETAESQNIAAHVANLNHNYITETRHKVASNLADGIPISPGEIITTNTDVIIGKPGKMGPRPPQTYLNDDKNIGMKPPPLPVPNIPVSPVFETADENSEDSHGQHTIDTAQIQILPARQVYEEHQKIPIGIPLNADSSLVPPQGQKPINSPYPSQRIGFKHNIMDNDPLLKPPNRPNVEQYANPNKNSKIPEWHPEKYRRPWSNKDPIVPPSLPPRFEEVHSEKTVKDKSWPTVGSTEGQERPLWAQKDPIIYDPSVNINAAESKPVASEPIIHQVPHVIDRATGQPLLVNIQPSQVANVVIPQGGTQALIFGDTSEPHINGQYFDDPSPYPEPEVRPAVSTVHQVHEHPQLPNRKNPINFMSPPSPSNNYKSSFQKQGPNHPHVIPLSVSRFDYGRPHGKRPVVHLIKRPDGSDSATGQGHVHTEILVHHRPEIVNGPHLSNGHPISHDDFSKIQKPNELPSPPRRTEVSALAEVPHRYIFQNKSDSGNEINAPWRSEKQPQRLPQLNNRPRQPRPPPRPIHSHNRPIYLERPNHRKPGHSPPPKVSPNNWNKFVVPHRPPQSPTHYYEPPRKPASVFFSTPSDNLTIEPTVFNYGESHTQESVPQYVPGKQDPHNTGTITQINRNEGNIPNGPVESHNPFDVEPQTTENKHPQFVSVSPMSGTEDSSHDSSYGKGESNNWNSDAETEKSELDSDVDASENVEIQKDDNKAQTNSTDFGDFTTERPHQSNYENSQKVEQTAIYDKNENSSTSDEKNPSAHKDDNNVTPVSNFKPESYDSSVYNTPTMQSKPFGVYSGNVDLETPYGYKRKDEKQDLEIIQGMPTDYYDDKQIEYTAHTGKVERLQPHKNDEVIDLKPPAMTTQYDAGSTKLNRVQQKPHNNGVQSTRPIYQRPEISQPSNKFDSRPNYGKRPTIYNPTTMRNEQAHSSQNGGTKTAVPSEYVNRFKNNTRPSHTMAPTQTTFGLKTPSKTQTNLEYPHLVTKPKPQVPRPITISTGIRKPDSNTKFSMQVDGVDDGKESKTQTERPASMLITKNTVKINKIDETLETAYQTNFALSNTDNDETEIQETVTKSNSMDRTKESILITKERPDVPSRDMRPPPLRTSEPDTKMQAEEGLKPPPPPSNEVVGLSPPPVDITTTNRPIDNRLGHDATSESKTPMKYIPLEESVESVPPPPPPSTNMVPPSLRPTHTRPFLMELLSQDMVPPSLILTTMRKVEIATVRPAVAVSGSIQIATAVATSHIPVVHDIESKIPIVHGTVDLPIVVDVPEMLRPFETRMTEHPSSIQSYNTRTATRIPVQPTLKLTSHIAMPTILTPVKDQILPSQSSVIRNKIYPTRTQTLDVPPNPVKRPELPILEPSYTSHVPSTRVKPTKSLPKIVKSDQHTTLPPIMDENVMKTQKPIATENNRKTEIKNSDVTRVTKYENTRTRTSTAAPAKPERKPNFKIETTKNETAIVISKVANQSSKSSTTAAMKSKEVTWFETSTVTTTETSVKGSPPTTRTLLITHTMISTTVETVTETVMRPISLMSTVTSTVMDTMTKMPTGYETDAENDSIFVVMSDQHSPTPGVEEVEAEYGDEDVSRDEQDPAGNEVHRVLTGSVLGAAIPHQPAGKMCVPECKANRAEVCAEVGNEMRCVCRPGFARMFLDRPCKPTYTYTLRVGLDRVGHELTIPEVNLNDTSSMAYKRLAIPTKDALDRTLMQSDLRDVYRGLKLVSFSPKPIQVKFHVQFSDNAGETRLKEVFQKYLIRNNYSLGGTEVYAAKDLESIEVTDFDECRTEEGGPHHDCSPHAVCFNLRGSYQCSCKEGWADLSENSAYPGRICSQIPLGCAACNNKGHCVTNTNGQETCECFAWHSGPRCQVNLKVLLIALVTTGAILLGLLALCLSLVCIRNPSHRRQKSADRRAMITGAGGDTSSEGSVADLAIPHHVPHILPPPPQVIAPLPPSKRPPRKINTRPRQPPRKSSMVSASGPLNEEHRDCSMTVMIPRAKYRSTPQSQQCAKPTGSAFATSEHKLISYLEGGHHTDGRRRSLSSNKDCKEAELQIVRSPVAPTGALVSAGFQVSATVVRTVDAESTLARSCGETTVEAATKVAKGGELQVDLDSTLTRSCADTMHASTSKLLRLDLAEAGSTLARSCGETTIQLPTKIAAGQRSSMKDSRDNRDSASEGHTMAERDLGSTLRLPAQHPPLYSRDRTSDRESNFDSL